MDAKGPEKKQRLLAALDQGMAMIHLDARRPGVVVPQQLRGETHLRLNLSYRFDPPDLAVGEWGVRSTLSFSGSRFTVAVPWSAVFAITSHVTREFWMYPEDMPPELLQLGVQERVEDVPPRPLTPRAARKAALKPVEALGDDDPPAPVGGNGSTGPELETARPAEPLPAAEAAKDAPKLRPAPPAPVELAPTPPLDDPPPEDGGKPRGRPHLRIVK